MEKTKNIVLDAARARSLRAQACLASHAARDRSNPVKRHGGHRAPGRRAVDRTSRPSPRGHGTGRARGYRQRGGLMSKYLQKYIDTSAQRKRFQGKVSDTDDTRPAKSFDRRFRAGNARWRGDSGMTGKRAPALEIRAK
ncbi:hypothetical protein [Burkholderia gladioli]|uniref:hypothetical protein n=1 Tax=Burkholderia gladioli TaxID=28095 RepID=UPI00163E82E1|nr:hypothetical protein [Burkholderia gladioli]